MVKVCCRYLYLQFFVGTWYCRYQIFVVANYPIVLLYIIGNTNYLFVVIKALLSPVVLGWCYACACAYNTVAQEILPRKVTILCEKEEISIHFASMYFKIRMSCKLQVYLSMHVQCHVSICSLSLGFCNIIIMLLHHHCLEI